MAPPASTAPNGVVKKRKKSAGSPSYGTYLRKLLDQIYPAPDKVGISSVAMDALNGLMLDLEQRIIDQSMTLAKFQKKATLSAKHVQTAALLVMPQDLARHTMKEAGRAVNAYAVAINAK